MNRSLKKLRNQFIITMMSIVILFLMTIFVIQYFSSANEMKTSSENSLKFALDSAKERMEFANNESDKPDMPEMDPQNFPGGASSTDSEPDKMLPPGFGDNMPGGRLMDNFGDKFARTPVLLVRVSEDGEFESIRNDIFYMEDEYIDEVLKATPYSEVDDKSHVMSEYHMRYMIRTEGSDTFIAYVDESDNHSTLSSLLKRSVLISSGVIIVMFILSLFLSKRVLAPVEKTWDDQRRFIADASHELKTPLAVIMSNADMISKSSDKNSERNMRRIDNVKTESERMKELVNELLEVARGDVESRDTIKEDINFSELLDDEVMVWEPTCYEAGRPLESDITPDLHLTGDATKLKRLVGILIDNAIKYSTQNTPIQVKLSHSSHGTSRIKLKVSNKGTPLSEEECHKIFERFYRADESREATPGYGLGLSIATNIVAEHGGTIKAYSDGKDTNTFSITM